MFLNQFNYYKVVKILELSQWLKKFGIIDDVFFILVVDEWLMKKVESVGSIKFLRSVSIQLCLDYFCGLLLEYFDMELDDILSEMLEWLVV